MFERLTHEILKRSPESYDCHASFCTGTDEQPDVITAFWADHNGVIRMIHLMPVSDLVSYLPHRSVFAACERILATIQRFFGQPWDPSESRREVWNAVKNTMRACAETAIPFGNAGLFFFDQIRLKRLSSKVQRELSTPGRVGMAFDGEILWTKESASPQDGEQVDQLEVLVALVKRVLNQQREQQDSRSLKQICQCLKDSCDTNSTENTNM